MAKAGSGYGRLPLSAYARTRVACAGVYTGLRRVGCLIAGTQKGGTTALASYFYEHPEISIPETKEVHFFDSEWVFETSAVDYAGYHAQFPVGADTRVLCDATPIYMYWNPAPERIRRYNPAMKWIFVLRDPIERAYSHWNMQRAKGRDALDFLEAITTESDRCRAALPLQHPWWSYADRGFYAQQLRRILQFFPAEQLLVLKSEDLRSDPAAVLERVRAFLGIAAFGPAASRDIYAGRYPMGPETEARRLLAERFEPDVRDLERLFGLDCSGWLRESRG
ncbi:MAG TPA: sulfotransferase [Casimicrobiaceae bacterium]